MGLARIADALSQEAAVGRLSQVCQRWIYSACLCFALDLDEQQRSGFAYGFAVYQLEYSRNLIFADGHRMQQVFDAVVDRTRSRLDVPKIRTVFGTAQRPRRTRRSSVAIKTTIERIAPTWTLFRAALRAADRQSVHKRRTRASVRGDRAQHRGVALRADDRALSPRDRGFQLAGIAERFCTALDCVDTGFIADGVLDELPTGSTLGATRVGGIDLNKQRMRDALSAVLALAPAPRGFTVGELATKVTR